MKYQVNDYVTVTRNMYSLKQGDQVQVYRVDKDSRRYDVILVNEPKLWIANIPADEFEGGVING